MAESEDTSRLIGRKGIIADALREVLSVAGKSENRRIHLKIRIISKRRIRRSNYSSFHLY
ncbi:MAG: hypothetical protein MZV49_05295 [Rhodopseudomonas palustris]|nr:hypothetical protein [Rhodopseudomonas palustris]